MESLKWYILEYQKGDKLRKDQLYNELVEIKSIVTQFKNKYYQRVTHKIIFKHKGLSNIFKYIVKQHPYFNRVFTNLEYDYVREEELKALFIKLLLEHIFTNGNLDNYTNEQLTDWTCKQLKFRITDELKENYDYEIEKNTTYNYVGTDDDGNNILVDVTDKFVFDEFQKIESIGDYIEFIKHIGGLENILNKSQMNIVNQRSVIGITMKEIADNLNCTKQNISERLTKIHNKVAREFLSYKSFKILTTTNIYSKINDFLIRYDSFEKNAGENNNNFGFLIDFLKENYKQGEQDVDFFKLHKNKPFSELSLFDLLTDRFFDTGDTSTLLIQRLHKNSWEKLYNILENNQSCDDISKKQKGNITRHCIKIFKSYIDQMEKVMKHNLEYSIQEMEQIN